MIESNKSIKDTIYICKNCKMIFKVYGLKDEPNVKFCPICASRELKESLRENTEEAFAKRLRELRKENSYTYPELAEKIGGHRNTLIQYENQKRTPEIETILLFAEIFDVSLDYLLGLSDERN